MSDDEIKSSRGGLNMLRVTPLELPEVLVLEYDRYEDNRGYSFCTRSDREFLEAGITAQFIEEAVYCPERAGTLYGIHVQNYPKAQTKLLYCIQGRGVDFAIDLRKESATYKKWVCVELSVDNRRQIYIPKGFGHAFLSLEDHTKVVMRIDEYFQEEFRRAIAWNDPELKVEFPVERPILSKKDVEAPLLKDSDCNL
jgi:dTDP-4-dehydrorhamnose 3,5-epimerase